MRSLKQRKKYPAEAVASGPHPSPRSTSKRVAVLRLHLPDGRILSNQLLDLDADGHVTSFKPLSSEVAFCEWFRGDWYFEASR